MRVRFVAFGLLAFVLEAAAAHAQTVISREISEEPVETVVIQGPGGTMVTRRPLAGGIGTVRPYVPAPFASSPRRLIVEDTEVLDSRAITQSYASTRPARTLTRTSARASAVTRTRTRTVSTARRTRPPAFAAAALPLDLTPVQRRVVYQTIVQQQVLPATGLVTVPATTPFYVNPNVSVGYTLPVASEVTSAYAAAYPAVSTYPSYTYPSSGYPVATYPVGPAIAQPVALAPVPQQLFLQVPVTRGYQYMVVNGRVLLVDPLTGIVVADVAGY